MLPQVVVDEVWCLLFDFNLLSGVGITVILMGVVSANDTDTKVGSACCCCVNACWCSSCDSDEEEL